MSADQTKGLIEDPTDYPIPMTRLEYVIDSEERAMVLDWALSKGVWPLAVEDYEEMFEFDAVQEAEWLTDASIMAKDEDRESTEYWLAEKYSNQTYSHDGMPKPRDDGIEDFREDIVFNLLGDGEYSEAHEEFIYNGQETMVSDFSLLMEGQTNRTVLGQMLDGDKEWSVTDNTLDEMYEKHEDLVDLRDTILLESEDRKDSREHRLKDWAKEQLGNFLDRTEGDVDYPSYIHTEEY